MQRCRCFDWQSFMKSQKMCACLRLIITNRALNLNLLRMIRVYARGACRTFCARYGWNDLNERILAKDFALTELCICRVKPLQEQIRPVRVSAQSLGSSIKRVTASSPCVMVYYCSIYPLHLTCSCRMRYRLLRATAPTSTPKHCLSHSGSVTLCLDH